MEFAKPKFRTLEIKHLQRKATCQGFALSPVTTTSQAVSYQMALARFGIAEALFFTPPLRKHALPYQVGLEGGLFLLQGHSEFAC